MGDGGSVVAPIRFRKNEEIVLLESRISGQKSLNEFQHIDRDLCLRIVVASIVHARTEASPGWLIYVQ